MTNNFSVLLKKYAVPLLFTVVGILMVVISFGQDSIFKIAAFMMLAAAILSLLYSSGKLDTKVIYAIGFVAGGTGLFVLYMSYKSVNDTSLYQENYKHCKLLAQQNLKDIRFIQKKHAEKNGKYIDNWEDFDKYAKNGTVPKLISKGHIPGRAITKDERAYLYGKNDNRPLDDNMTLQEAYLLSKWKEGENFNKDFNGFVRDTIQISFMESKFETKSYVRSRKTANFNRFSIDSLKFIPYTGAREKWTLKTEDSIQIGEVKLPAILVEGVIPFSKMQGTKNETMKFGSLTTNDLEGSWEVE